MTVYSATRPFSIRELSAADTHACAVFIRHLAPEDIRLRFASLYLSPAHLLPRGGESAGAAFLAVDAAGTILGVVNLIELAAGAAEIAVIVRSDHKRRGIGRALLVRAIEWAAAREVGELIGLVLAENTAMLGLAAAMGFRGQRRDGYVVEVRRAVPGA
jgi:acetyltransferase